MSAARVASLAEMRRELHSLRGHYADMGKSLEALGAIQHAVEELDEKLTSFEKHSRGTAIKQKARSATGAAVDLEEHNGFDIRVRELLLDRLQKRNGALLPHTEGTRIFVGEVATWLRERGVHFCDPEQIPLELNLGDPPMRLDLPRELRDLLRRDEEVGREMDEVRQEEMAPVLRRVQLWRRLSRLTAGPTLFARGNDLLQLRPQGFKVPAAAVHTLPKFEQGLISDDWFLLSVALVAQRRPTMMNLFASAEARELGMYVFQFYQPPDVLGEGAGWRCVTIDDLVPCCPAKRQAEGRVEYLASDCPMDQQLLPVFGLTDQPSEMWLILLEKAYAKFLGSYSLLHRGDTARSLTHMTAGSCTMVQWDPEAPDDATLATLWWQLRESARLGLLQACMMSDVKDNNAAGAAGLVEKDCYQYQPQTRVSSTVYQEWKGGDVVLLTAEMSPDQLYEMPVCRERGRAFVREGAKLIKIRNLLGADEWDGDWSHTSPLWTPGSRELVGYNNMDEHIAWMKIRDFAAQYNTLMTCCDYHAGPLAWPHTFVGYQPEEVLRHHEQFLLTVTAPIGCADTPSTPRLGSKQGSSHPVGAEQPRTLAPDSALSSNLNASKESGASAQGMRSITEMMEDDEEPLLPVSIYVTQPDKEDFTYEQNYADGADQAEELEISLFRVTARQLVEPAINDPSASAAVDPDALPRHLRRKSSLEREEEGKPPITWEWPEDAQREAIRDSDSGPPRSEFVSFKKAWLAPGHYVLTVGQSEVDAKQEVRCFVAVFNDEDETGRTASPFASAAKARSAASPYRGKGGGPSPTPSSAGGGRRRRPTGWQLDAERIGSAANPGIERRKPRPPTPFEAHRSRIEAATARPGSALPPGL